ncbi:unnamed protein product, partial [Rotaria sp. Silwood2]
FALSGEKHEADDKDPATIADEILSLLRSEENGTVNKEQFIIGCIKIPILAELFADNLAKSS